MPIDTFDAIVIGSGQGGGPLAGQLAGAGWKTAIVEREHIGGTCVNVGCTPTKTMVASARITYLARRASDYGVRTGAVTVDQSTVRQRKREIVESWSNESRKGLERWDKLEIIMGEASFVGSTEIRVDLGGGSTRSLTSEKIFINTGARPRIPPIDGLDQVPYLDSTSIMEVGGVPDHLLIIGGGYIGLEFGQMFRRFGSQVTIVEMAPRCLPREDSEICATMSDILQGGRYHPSGELPATTHPGTKRQSACRAGDSRRNPGPGGIACTHLHRQGAEHGHAQPRGGGHIGERDWIRPGEREARDQRVRGLRAGRRGRAGLHSHTSPTTISEFSEPICSRALPEPSRSDSYPTRCSPIHSWAGSD